MTAADAVRGAVRGVAFGPPATHLNLTLVPLLVGHDRDADYRVLDEALAGGWVEITEVGEAGRVPELKVVNSGDLAVLLLDGEELVGAKQNRVLNLTILIPAHESRTIPVSCVEAGRWRHVTRRFGASPRAQFAEGRAAKMRQVTASLLSTGARRSNQGAVWEAIAEKSARLGARSGTGAMSAMYEQAGASLDAFVAAFRPVPGQAGAVFLVDGVPSGLELFDSPATWRKLVPKLVRSYALDAIDRGSDAGAPGASRDTGRALIDQLASSESAVFPAVGEGEDVRLTGGGLTGAALVALDRAVHISAFPAVM